MGRENQQLQMLKYPDLNKGENKEKKGKRGTGRR